MPHIVLEKAKNVKECYDAIEPMMQQLEKGILKITNKYIDYKENSALIESISIEDGKTQNFFIQLSSKGEAVTVRLFPLTDPEKTKGVKALMGIVAKKIKDSNVEINYGKTNLQDFLIE
ncbi:hypothetical protein LXN10_01665 [Arcobacter sp. KX21116]|uniref:hypothetical protein n=1 Tax=Arcobacter iocasae TaxID=2906515 RepID=UPI0035D42D41